MSQKYKFMGCNDDADTCSVCGKKELKKVVWLQHCDCDGNADDYAFAVGTTCAARMLGWSHETSKKTKDRVTYAALDALAEQLAKEFKEMVNDPSYVVSSFTYLDARLVVQINVNGMQYETNSFKFDMFTNMRSDYPLAKLEAMAREWYTASLLVKKHNLLTLHPNIFCYLEQKFFPLTNCNLTRFGR